MCVIGEKQEPSTWATSGKISEKLGHPVLLSFYFIDLQNPVNHAEYMIGIPGFTIAFQIREIHNYY